MRMVGVIASLVLFACCAAEAAAQEALCLVGDDAKPDRILLRSGQPAKSVPWGDHSLAWLFVRGDGNQLNLQQAAAAPDDASAFVLEQVPRGCFVVGADFAPRIQTFPATEWAAFLKAHTSAPAPQVAADPVPPTRVRRVESCKTILRSGPGGDGSAVSKTGQAVEIRAQMDPTLTPPGSDVALRAYSNGAKLARARLTARHLDSGRVQELTSDPEGIANLRITDAGWWRVELHHATKLAGDADADWELRTATLAFKAPPPPEGRP